MSHYTEYASNSGNYGAARHRKQTLATYTISTKSRVPPRVRIGVTSCLTDTTTAQNRASLTTTSVLTLERQRHSRDKEFEIDFQAYVLDRAGNVGFSDADSSKPGLIRDLGTTDKDNKRDAKSDNYVLGMYSAHVVRLDERDPYVVPESVRNWLLRSRL